MAAGSEESNESDDDPYLQERQMAQRRELAKRKKQQRRATLLPVPEFDEEESSEDSEDEQDERRAAEEERRVLSRAANSRPPMPNVHTAAGPMSMVPPQENMGWGGGPITHPQEQDAWDLYEPPQQSRCLVPGGVSGSTASNANQFQTPANGRTKLDARFGQTPAWRVSGQFQDEARKVVHDQLRAGRNSMTRVVWADRDPQLALVDGNRLDWSEPDMQQSKLECQSEGWAFKLKAGDYLKIGKKIFFPERIANSMTAMACKVGSGAFNLIFPKADLDSDEELGQLCFKSDEAFKKKLESMPHRSRACRRL